MQERSYEGKKGSIKLGTKKRREEDGKDSGLEGYMKGGIQD